MKLLSEDVHYVQHDEVHDTMNVLINLQHWKYQVSRIANTLISHKIRENFRSCQRRHISFLVTVFATHLLLRRFWQKCVFALCVPNYSTHSSRVQTYYMHIL